jgi:hypothetical protein
LIEEGLVTPAGDERRSRPQHRIATSEPVSPLVTDQRR